MFEIQYNYKGSPAEFNQNKEIYALCGYLNDNDVESIADIHNYTNSLVKIENDSVKGKLTFGIRGGGSFWHPFKPLCMKAVIKEKSQTLHDRNELNSLVNIINKYAKENLPGVKIPE